RHRPAVLARDDPRHRQCRTAGGGHRGAPRVDLRGYGCLPRAAPGSGDEEAVPRGRLCGDSGLAEELAGARLFPADRPRDAVSRARREAVHRVGRGDGDGHRQRHTDELPQRGAVARDQGARRHGDDAAAGDRGGDARQRDEHRQRPGSRHDRAGQDRRRHRRQRQPAVRHCRAVERGDRREGRHRVQGRPEHRSAHPYLEQPMKSAVSGGRHEDTKTRSNLCTRLSSWFRAFVAVPFLSIALAAAQPPNAAPAQDLQHPQNTNAGIYAFTGRCATCHDSGRDGATDRYALNRFTPEQVLTSITTGSMKQYAEGLSEFEKRVVAVYVGGRPLGANDAGDAAKMRNRCEAPRPFAPAGDADWSGWGADSGNSRFHPKPAVTAADAPKLTLKWAFGFPNGNSAYGQPTVSGGRVFAGADTGFVYSLDAASGCVYWSFRANAGVRTAVTIGKGSGAHRYLAYFGDVKANVYAGDAETGAEVWSDRIDRHPVARVTGAPKLVDGRLYVPISSLEESGAGNPSYPCCSFRGGVASYDAQSGKRFWTSYTVAEKASPLKKTST